MKKIQNVFTGIGLLFFFNACFFDDIAFQNIQNKSVSFSIDTTDFDTILVGKLSITKRVFVFNNENKGIDIPFIRLARGKNPFIKIIVNGVEGQEFTDIKILPKDSILILISFFIPQNPQQDSYLFQENISIGGLAFHPLKVYIQNTRFIPQVLKADAFWDSRIPYVIEDTFLIPKNTVLTIDAGAKIFMGNKASIFVAGTIICNGTPQNPIIFTSVRQDGNYKKQPGQWGALYILEGSDENILAHTIITNATTGIRIGSPDANNDFDITISHSIISNISTYGILAFSSDVYCFNTLIYNCGRGLVVNVNGGFYTYQHCTFASRYSIFAQADEYSFIFTDDSVSGIKKMPLSVFMANNILLGSKGSAFGFRAAEGNFIFEAHNNAVSVSKDIFTLNTEGISDNIFLSNADSLFMDERHYDFRLKKNSPVINKGKQLQSNITDDIKGNKRDALPDIGAYEWKKL